MSWHDLFVIEAECGNCELAKRYAGEALAAYPDNHPTLLWLVHDIGYLRMTGGAFGDALRIFTVLEPRIPPQRKPHIFGAIAYAAGGSGDEEAYESARDTLSGLDVNPGTAEAWLEVARGAMHLGRIDEARVAVRTSRAIAAERSEHKIVFEAEALAERCADLTENTELEEEAHVQNPAEHFAERIVQKLATV